MDLSKSFIALIDKFNTKKWCFTLYASLIKHINYKNIRYKSILQAYEHVLFIDNTGKRPSHKHCVYYEGYRGYFGR